MYIYHYDIARGAYLKPAIFKQALQLAARSGFTHFLPYLENMLRVPSMERACPDCAYTAEEWQAFDATAREAGIELMPHFNVIGHTDRICEVYPELAGKPGEKQLDVTLDIVRDWTVRCLEEFCVFSEGEMFLIGGDEWQTPNHLLADPAFDVGMAWAGQINLACDCLVKQGRVPVVWHDMLMHYPNALEALSRDAVIAFWFYDEDSDYPVLDTFRQYGFRTIMASGMCNGTFSPRRKRAFDCAIAAAEWYGSDGVMMTSWTDGRWEKQSLNIALIGQILRGETPPQPIVNALGALECLDKLPHDSAYSEACRARLGRLAEDDAWQAFPTAQEWIRTVAAGDTAREREIYQRSQEPEGPLWDALFSTEEAVGPKASEPTPAAAPRRDRFGLTVEESGPLGPALRVCNGAETFVVYPKYGASLQDWQIDGVPVIAHSLPSFREACEYLPGGYRSYKGVGGFRPIWALGTQHNPCILWQGPFEFAVLEKTYSVVELELCRDMAHVTVRYRVRVVRGEPGFRYSAEASNKMANCFGAFNFNLALAVRPEDVDATGFEWEENGVSRDLTLNDQFDSFFVIPAAAGIHVRTRRWEVVIESDPDTTAGYYTDWSTRFLTPDLHGQYRALAPGDRYATTWRFTATARMGRSSG